MTRTLVAVSALSLAAAACTHAGHAPGPAASRAPAAAPAPGGMAELCPMNVPGTQVSAADTSDGEAVTFTTAPENVTALRAKVHAMAEMHNRHHAAMEQPQGGSALGSTAHADGVGMGAGGMGHGGMGGPEATGGTGHGGMGGPEATGGTGHGGMGTMHMPPPSKASVEDVPNGARIRVTPNDPADLQRLQETIRMHAAHMQRHGCEMTMDHAGRG